VLPNGLKLMIVEQHELPLADFALLVGSGGTADPTGKTGVANLTSAMLREGTTTRKSLDIADQTSFLGISLFPQASWESSTLSLHTPTAQLDSALALFADVALHPSFPANEFERIKKNRLTELLHCGIGDRRSPTRLSGDSLWKCSPVWCSADRQRGHGFIADNR
jgi:zinc protease